MATEKSLSVPQFSGKNSDWPSHRLQLRAAAKLICPTLTSEGLVPLMCQPNDAYLQQFPGLQLPINWPANPGPPPVFDPNFTVAEVGRYNAELANWKIRNDINDSFQNGKSTLKNIIVSSLPEITIRSIGDPHHGTMLMAIADIMDACDLMHGTLNSQDLKIVKASTKIPYTSDMDMRAYVATHVLAHATAHANGQPYPEQDKFWDFINSIKPCGLFTSHIDNWLIQHGDVLNQLFTPLSDAAKQWYNNMDKTTVAQLNFSAAVVPHPPLPPSSTLSAQDIANIAAAVHALNLQQATPRSRAQPPPALPPQRPYYCWTHGPGNHPGTACNKPRRGHKAHATLTNQMGGKA